MKPPQRWQTALIAPETWPEVVSAAIQVLRERGVEEVVTLHGWTESEFADHPQFGSYEWVELCVRVEDLPTAVQERQAAGFTWGRDDWFWVGERPALGTTFELLFCHEGDVHLSADEPRLGQALAHAFGLLGVPLIAREPAP